MMMGGGSFKLFICVLLVPYFACFASGFTPADMYLIDCGSPTNTTVGDRVFMADNLASQLLSTPENILANNTSANSATSSGDSALYQTARIFTATTKYTFSISQRGRHWIRLYFYPFVYRNYNLSLANFSVSTPNYVLLGNFNPAGLSFKEFSVNVTSSTLEITMTPFKNSFAYLNALEVVSVPDILITDDAASVNPPGVSKV
ncbi:unnamed protein product [Ilex paraguariensis]|uniref:Malectin-like domain-containing protein n=1 Tax=Ilex paraguariensis TaxID=185542 RepID=A0ABC8SI81_9AQUA